MTKVMPFFVRRCILTVFIFQMVFGLCMNVTITYVGHESILKKLIPKNIRRIRTASNINLFVHLYIRIYAYFISLADYFIDYVICYSSAFILDEYPNADDILKRRFK